MADNNDLKLRANLSGAVLAHALRFIAPLAVYPYLARVFGLTGFGIFAFCQATAQIITQFVEFGFSNMGGRELAEAHEDSARARDAASALICARAMLLCLTATASAVALPILHAPAFHDHLTVVATIIAGVSYGLTPAWYYLGIEKAARLASYELAAQMCSFSLVFIFVHGPADVPRALLASALPVLAVGLFGHGAAIRQCGWRMPKLKQVFTSLGKSLAFFILLGAPSVVNRATIVLLGIVGDPAQVAYLAAGERLATAASAALGPFTRVLLPRITILLGHDLEAARRLFRKSVVAVSAMFGGAAIVGAFISPWFTPVFFGSALRSGWPVVSLMLLMVIPIATSRMIGFCGLVPLHRERALQWVVLACSCLSLALALPLIPVLGAMGVGCARLFGELLVLAGAATLMLQLAPEWFGVGARR